MELALASVSYLGVWYQGPPLPLEDVFHLARRTGYRGVEINSKRPHGSPIDLDSKRRSLLRELADAEGLVIPAISANNDLTSPIPEQLESQLVMVREVIRLASDLGSPVVRLFLAWPGVIVRADGVAQYETALHHWVELRRITTRQEMWERGRRSLSELAQFAGEQGVTLALQNHGPVIRNPIDVLDMINEVNSPALKACLDAPLLDDQSDIGIVGAVSAIGALQVHTHVLAEFRRTPEGLSQRSLDIGLPATQYNYPAFVQALASIGYQGSLSYEFCHPALNDRHELQDRRYVDLQVELAAEYFSELIAEAKTSNDTARSPSSDFQLEQVAN